MPTGGGGRNAAKAYSFGMVSPLGNAGSGQPYLPALLQADAFRPKLEQIHALPQPWPLLWE